MNNINLQRQANESEREYEKRINSSVITIADAHIDSAKWEEHTGLSLVEIQLRNNLPIDIKSAPVLCVKLQNSTSVSGELDIGLRYYNGQVYPDFSKVLFVGGAGFGTKTVIALTFKKMVFESDCEFSARMKALPLVPLGLARPLADEYNLSKEILPFELKLRKYAIRCLQVDKVYACLGQSQAQLACNVTKNYKIYASLRADGMAENLEVFNEQIGKTIRVDVFVNTNTQKKNYVQPIPTHIDLKEIAHPVDKTLIKILETMHVKALLNKPMEQLVASNYGSILQTGIPLKPNNFPVEYQLFHNACSRLGIKEPYAVIAGLGSDINAFATGTDEEPYIVVGNMAPKLLSPKELQFVISHECGHVAMEHMVYHVAGDLAGRAGGFLPVVGPIVAKTITFPLNYWNRCSEITADRIGLVCCEDLHVAQKALLKIVAGFTDVADVDIDEYIEQSTKMRDKHLLGRIGEYFASHPMIFKRIKALELFYNSELYYRITNQALPSNKNLITKEELDKKVEELLTVVNLDALKNTMS